MAEISVSQMDHYMDRTAQQCTPPNFWWHVRRATGDGFVFVIAMISMAALIGLAFYYGSYAYLWSAIGIFGLVSFLHMLGGLNQIEPGVWKSYSPYQCHSRFPDFFRKLQPIVEEIRKGDSMAEFEVAVLEQAREYHGAILFQLVDDHPAPAAQRTDAGSPERYRKPVFKQVFGVTGEPMPNEDFLYLATRA